MPYANLPESEWSKMDSCVEQVMAKGHDKQGAIAICYTALTEGKSEKLTELNLSLDDFAGKIGARNNAQDKERIRMVRKSAKEIVDHTLALEPDDEDKPDQQTMKAGNLPGTPAQFEAASIKAVGDWELDVLAIPWGKDKDSQWFDEQTDLMLTAFKSPAIIYYHGVDPSGKSLQSTPELIGDPVGSPFLMPDGYHQIVKLNKGKALAKRVWEAAKRGAARASSGAISHLARLEIDGKLYPYDKNRPGRIAVWPFAELSLFDMGEGRNPANRFAVATPTVKTVYTLAGLTLPDIANQPEDSGALSAEKSTTPQEGNYEMTPDEINELVNAAIAKAEKERAAKEEATKAEAAKLAEAVKTARAEWEAEAVKANRLPTVTVTQFADTGKFDAYSAADLSLTAEVLRSHGIKATPALHRALAIKMAEDKSPEASYLHGSLKAAGIEPAQALKAATDPMYTYTAIGTEWVGTAYSTELWRLIRAQNNVVAKIPTTVIPDGYNNMYFPLEVADPTWYKVPEVSAADSTMKVPAATVTASQATTGQKQITVAKMGARVMYSGELEEDALIPFSAQLRQQLADSGAEMMEHVVIDGDTATSSNINDIGGTTYSGAATTLFLLTNGFRKYALVTGTSKSRSGGALGLEDYVNTMRLIGANGVGADISKISFIVDANVHFANMALPEALTKDVYSGATFENGYLTQAFGVPIIPSWQMQYRSTVRKANSAGKIDLDTTTNNLYGAILCVRWDQWKLAYKRRMTMETTRFANSDSWEIVALARWGLAYKNLTDCAAITYGLNV